MFLKNKKKKKEKLDLSIGIYWPTDHPPTGVFGMDLGTLYFSSILSFRQCWKKKVMHKIAMKTSISVKKLLIEGWAKTSFWLLKKSLAAIYKNIFEESVLE